MPRENLIWSFRYLELQIHVFSCQEDRQRTDRFYDRICGGQKTVLTNDQMSEDSNVDENTTNKYDFDENVIDDKEFIDHITDKLEDITNFH